MPSQNTNIASTGITLNATIYRDGRPTVFSRDTAQHSRVIVVRSSSNTPNFRSRRLKWNLPMNAFSYSKKTYSGLHGLLIQPQTGSYITRTGSVLELYCPAPDIALSLGSIVASLDIEARTKIRLKLKDQKTNLAQVFAERQQIADLIGDTAIRFAKAILALKKCDYRAAGNHLGIHVSSRAVKRYNREYRKSQSKATASGWLGLQYGWLPLLGDVKGAAELLAQKLSNEIKGKAVATASRDLAETRNLGWSNVAYPGNVIKYTHGKTQVKYVIYYATTASSLKTAAQLGITNPLALAWELVPFSFVADWFIPIGNYLSSLDGALGLRFLKGSKTVFTDAKVISERKSGGRTDGYSTYCDVRYWYTEVSCTRQVLSDFPSSGFPQFQNPFSFTRAANAIALLRTTMGDTVKHALAHRRTLTH